MYNGFELFKIDRSVDVQALPASVRSNGLFFTALDPTAGNRWVMLRVNRIHEVDRIFFTFVFLYFFILN
jgi:hypothetical protein